jgi:hypothetical protein
MAYDEDRISELRQQAGGKFSDETERILERWKWNTVAAQRVWTVVPPKEARLSLCRYEPACHFHAEGGARSEMCRWRR